jgi:hypothetical protein
VRVSERTRQWGGDEVLLVNKSAQLREEARKHAQVISSSTAILPSVAENLCLSEPCVGTRKAASSPQQRRRKLCILCRSMNQGHDTSECAPSKPKTDEKRKGFAKGEVRGAATAFP